jgi:hypothetical protein
METVKVAVSRDALRAKEPTQRRGRGRYSDGRRRCAGDCEHAADVDHDAAARLAER